MILIEKGMFMRRALVLLAVAGLISMISLLDNRWVMAAEQTVQLQVAGCST